MSMVQPNASGAQREPSMEEILASIRRIIEDSDTVQRADRADPVEAEGGDSEPANALQSAQATEADSAVADDVSAFQAELGTARAVEEDMADGVSAEEQADTSPASLPDQAIAETPEASFVEPIAQPSPEPEAVATATQDHPETVQQISPEERQPVSQTASRSSAPFFNGDASGSVASEVPNAATGQSAPLVSSQTGNQVAAAFSDLSVATEARGRRTFDDIAGEMLRPMLREWLDNNLPHLVERLVREEIERIARGGAPR